MKCVLSEGHGKLEKAEILELTVEYIKKMQEIQETKVQPKEEPPEDEESTQRGILRSRTIRMGGIRENWGSEKNLSVTDIKLQMAMNHEDSAKQAPLEHSHATEMRPKVLVQQKTDFHSEANGRCTTPKSVSTPRPNNTMSVIRSRINSRTQEFQSKSLKESEADGSKNSKPCTSTVGNTRDERRSRRIAQLEYNNANGDDMSSSSSNSDSSELQTDTSATLSSDSGYRTCGDALPRAVSATPLSVSPQSYGIPSYALHPAGTHYIPVVLHPNVPLPPVPLLNLGANQMMSNVLPMPYGFGVANSLNPLTVKAGAQFGLPNHPFPMFFPGTQNGYSGQSSSSGNSTLPSSENEGIDTGVDTDVDVCSTSSSGNQHSSLESIATQTDYTVS